LVSALHLAVSIAKQWGLSAHHPANSSFQLNELNKEADTFQECHPLTLHALLFLGSLAGAVKSIGK